MNRNRLAVIIPVKDGGDLLRRTVTSCGESRLSPEEVTLLVLDNCSTDGAAQSLPQQLPNGLTVRTLTNASDLGRVGNWNRGVEIARQMGFGYVTFLFAGDTWLPDSGMANLFRYMRESDADLGLGAYLIVNQENQVLRRSARVSLEGKSKAVIPGEEFWSAMLHRGHLPITPLQANVYRLRSDDLPRFDAARPLTTDMDGTLEYLANGSRSVAISSEPVCAWLARKGRVFCSSGLEAFMSDHFRQLRYASQLSGIPVNWTHAKSVFLLGYAMNARTFTGWRGLPEVFRTARASLVGLPGKVNVLDMARLLAGKFLRHRSSLHLQQPERSH